MTSDRPLAPRAAPVLGASFLEAQALFFLPVLLVLALAGLCVFLEIQRQEALNLLQNMARQGLAPDAASLADAQEKGVRLLILFGLMILTGGLLVVAMARHGAINRRILRENRKAGSNTALYAAALRSLRVGVLIRDARREGQPVVFINHAFTDVTGYEAEDIVGRGPDFLFGWQTDAEVLRDLREALETSRPAAFTLLTYRKDGSYFWGEWQLSPVCERPGEHGCSWGGKGACRPSVRRSCSPDYHVLLITDVTSLRQAQNDLVRAKETAEHASAVKSNFLAVMSHEIRTPLNGILGVLDLMKDTPLNEEQGRYLETCVASSQALQGIINDVLDYSRLEAGKTELVVEAFALRPLLQTVADLVQPIAASKNLWLEMEVDDEVPDVLVSDPGHLRQILLNLLSNAIKFTDKGGVTLSITHLMTQEEHGRVSAFLRFDVADTGIGISAEDQDKLFKDFSQIERSYTRRFGGTGLGLAITRKLVRLLGGEISVESRVGQGSRFWFMVPMPLASGLPLAAGAEEGEGESVVDASMSRILLVEDNATNRMVAEKYLAKGGYRFDSVESGAKALQLAQRGEYDLILMDISMPEMDGFETTRRLRRMGRWAETVPVLALTAHVMQGDREACLAAGMNDHLAKPLSYAALSEALARWIFPSRRQDSSSVRSEGPDGAAQAIVSLDMAGRTPVLDPGALRHLADDLGRDTVLRVTQVFLEDSARRLAYLKVSGAATNLETVLHEAHTLKSSSASCGLMRFSTLMAELETAAACDNKPLVEALLGHVEPSYAEAREELLRERREYGGV